MEREQLLREAEESELRHLMTCRQVGCARCEDETPPVKKVNTLLREAA